ncbi:MAG TPA: uL13 family ribosomal protein, partial [Thermoproteota archaeon]|nr:uL13 family ribosomal protein [Thermoproteota archaeon]
DGKKVVVVNAGGAVISGTKEATLREIQEFATVRSAVNPKNTPRHFSRPDMMMKRIIRGMLPRRKPRGREALKRLKIYLETPTTVEGEPLVFEGTGAAKLSHKYVRLQEISDRIRSRGR